MGPASRDNFACRNIGELAERAGEEPARADVGGRSIPRADGETAEAFLARVEAEAKLAPKPGCAGMALVWPEIKSDGRSRS